MALDTLNQDQTLACQVKIWKPSCLLTHCGDGVVMAVSWFNQSLGMSNQSENEICFLSVSLRTHKYAHTPTCKVSHVESVRALLIVHWGTQVAVKCLASGWRNEQTKQPEKKELLYFCHHILSLQGGFHNFLNHSRLKGVAEYLWNNLNALSESLQLQIARIVFEYAKTFVRNFQIPSLVWT